uniref:Uncharacterized protein n=1 Tax=Panagrolaimus sp. PS1159 TaxID=55785 RepID=A0AC35GJT7_9BILA
MSSHGGDVEEAPLEEEQIIIPVLSEEEVKLEKDEENYGNEKSEGNENDKIRDINIGSEVQLEENRSNENYESEESQRQMFTSQDDYELVSSKQSSHASMNDHEKTPTPPPQIVLEVSPTPSPPPSPITGVPVSSSTTIVVEGLDDHDVHSNTVTTTSSEIEDLQIIQQKNHQTFFQSILRGLAVIAEWLRWAFMDNKWGDIFTHKQEN